jgi:hypothetical protein
MNETLKLIKNRWSIHHFKTTQNTNGELRTIMKADYLIVFVKNVMGCLIGAAHVATRKFVIGGPD